MEFAPFDQRRYPTVGVQEGYGEWARTYESIVQDEMDLRLLERLSSVDWRSTRRTLDLACGTGRIGAWLTAQGVGAIEGIDFTPEMLAKAEARGLYAALHQGDIRDTGLPAGRFDLLIQVLACEHLPDLRPLYAETARLAAPGAQFVIVGYHSHFLMNGIPTHFDRADGQPVAIESHIHLFSDHAKAAKAAGWHFSELEEGVVDEEWLAKKPKWAKYRHHPVSFALVWRR